MAPVNKKLANKASMIQQIQDAKLSHKNWVKKADRLVNGLNGYKEKQVYLDVDKTFIPLESSSCDFGVWFNNFAIHLSNFNSIGSCLGRIEQHHNELHETYEKIYFIFFVKPEQKSFIEKLLTFNAKKVSDLDREKAQIHLEYLKRSSKDLLEALQVLEDKIRIIDYTELQKFQ